MSAPPRIDWIQLPLVMAGGGVGVLARYLLTLAAPGGDLVPLLAINAVGSLLLGVVAGAFGDAPRRRAFLGTGILGGFTSYSALAPALGVGLSYTFLAVPLALAAVAVVVLAGVVSVALALAGLSLGGAFARRRTA